MPNPPIRPLVDKILGGKLDSVLADRRAAGDSWRAIANWLRDEHGVDVSPESLRLWGAKAKAEAK